MKRDKEWLKEKLNTEKYYRGTNELETKTTYGELYDRGVRDGINTALEFVNQLQEPEVKELERKIKELDSYNDELIRDNNQLRNELDSLDSQFMGLHTSYDEQIKSLEYELFVEKTRDSEHKFYWFTAKKTPFIVDISYMSNENHFYGFKQVPNYYFIENHDLRFITNCSLDDLVEQFR